MTVDLSLRPVPQTVNVLQPAEALNDERGDRIGAPRARDEFLHRRRVVVRQIRDAKPAPQVDRRDLRGLGYSELLDGIVEKPDHAVGRRTWEDFLAERVGGS